jgi:hypothetical protein
MSRAILNNENTSSTMSRVILNEEPESEPHVKKMSRAILNDENFPPMETVKSKDKENWQKIDTRLILNNATTMTADEFISIVREYMWYDTSSTNATEAYIINRVECPYKRKEAYQNKVRERKTRVNFSIIPTDLTPTYMPAESLTQEDKDSTPHSINAVRLHSSLKRKTARVKFRINKLSKNTDNGENWSTVINAQGDTGANCSATDTIDIIHNYVQFPIPQNVGVFSADETGSMLCKR